MHLGMSGSLSFGAATGRARPARPLRPRHGARHACASPIRAASAPSSGRRRPTPRRRRRCSPASASSPSTTASTAPISTPRCAGAGSPSRRRSSAARSSSAPATSMRARRCSRRASIRALRSDRISRARAALLADAVRSTLGPRRRARRLDLAQFPRRSRRCGRVPARCEGLRARGQAVRPLRDADPAHRPGGEGDVLLSGVPATLTSAQRMPTPVCETPGPARVRKRFVTDRS